PGRCRDLVRSPDGHHRHPAEGRLGDQEGRSMGSMKTWGWLPLVVWLGMPAALAQVTLQTDVSKVVSTLDAGGRVERELVPVEEVMPGEELRYTITFRNESNTPVEAERIVITNPLPEGTVYVPGSAGGEGTLIE